MACVLSCCSAIVSIEYNLAQVRAWRFKASQLCFGDLLSSEKHWFDDLMRGAMRMEVVRLQMEVQKFNDFK